MELLRDQVLTKFTLSHMYSTPTTRTARNQVMLLNMAKNATVIVGFPPRNHPIMDISLIKEFPEQLDLFIVEKSKLVRGVLGIRVLRDGDRILLGGYSYIDNQWMLTAAIGYHCITREFEEVYPTVSRQDKEEQAIINELLAVSVNNLVTYLTYVKEVINPNIINHPRLRNMKRGDKQKQLVYKLNYGKLISDSPVEDPEKGSSVINTDESAEDKITFMTSNKTTLMSKIVKAGGLGNTDPQKELMNVAMDLSPSILFLEVHPDPKTLTASAQYTFEYLPFPDLMFYCDMVVDNADGTEMIHTRGLLLRVKRVDDKVNLFIYRENNAKKYAFCAVGEVTVGSTEFKLKLPVEQTKLTAFNDELINILIPVIKHSLWTITQFEPRIKNDPTKTFSVRKKVKEKDRQLFLEYTLNLLRPTHHPKRKSLGGTHASPVEHLRRGHWRTARNGRRFFVEARVINEGKGGRIEKDYIV